MTRRNLQALIAALALSPGVTLVERGAQAAEQSAHVHGQAGLQVAAEGMVLELYFKSPAVNIVGFEHAPRSEAQREQVTQAAAQLREQPLVRLPLADDCAMTDASVASALLEADHSDEGHAHDHEYEHRHTSFEVTQRLECEGGSLSGPVQASVMQAFEGIEQLRVEWLDDGGQGAARLTREQMRFSMD